MTYESMLLRLLAENDRVIVLTAENRAAIRGLPEAAGPRFIDTGICEQTLVGVSAGLALRGRIPIVHALAAFLTMRAFEFIRTDIGYPRLPVKLVGFAPGLLSEANGPTHQAVEDIALMRGIPGMTVFCPADLEDLTIGFPKVLDMPGPAYIRYTQQPAAVHHDERFEIGRAETLARGSDVTILTHGPLFAEALRAAEILGRKGVSAGVINLRMLSPIDEDAIREAAWTSARLVTLEDHAVRGGLPTIVAEILRNAGASTPVLALGLDRHWFRPAFLPKILANEGLTGDAIASRILSLYFREKEDSCL